MDYNLIKKEIDNENLERLEKAYTLTVYHSVILRSMIKTFNYFLNEKTTIEGKVMTIRDFDTSFYILDYNLDYLLLMKKYDKFYVLKLSKGEMLQLKLVI